MQTVIVGHGSKVLIGNRVWEFGSVAGYAAEMFLQQTSNHHQTTRNYTQGWSLQYHIRNEIKRAVQNRHELVWLNPLATVLLSDRDRYVEARAKERLMRETIPKMTVGDIVTLEGDNYTLTTGNHSDHIKLVYAGTPNGTTNGQMYQNDESQAERMIEAITRMMASLEYSPKSLLRGIQDLIELETGEVIKFDKGSTPWWR